MKLSEKWLREWINPSLDSNELVEQLTLAGLEVDSIAPVAGHFTKVVVGQVVSVAPHPDPKVSRLQVCQVDIGTELLLSIVCGATNARAELKVAVACIGATLPNNISIKEVKLRGVLSQGMLCSATELGLTTEKESSGILELPLDATLGQDLHTYLQLADHTLDVHLTPNRGDCLSVQGLARDLAALTGSPLNVVPLPTITTTITEQLTITVQSASDCPYYSGRIIRDINPDAESPLWLTERLRRSGFRAIHPVVDVTNYVLLERGQPLHAFDLSHLDSEIIVRRAKQNEKILLLDSKEVYLESDTLVIADKTRVQAIAGVMGGLDSAVSASTTDIFLESAFFTPAALAGRARHYGLNSESAYRFERGVDPHLAFPAIERATQLLLEIVGGKVAPITEKKGMFTKPSPIMLRESRIKKILGITFRAAEILSILQRLGMTVIPHETEENSWEVTPPSWRFDIFQEVDLIEELARVHGYDKIPLSFSHSAQHLLASSETALPLSRLRHLLVDRDYHEVITYSFTSPQLQQDMSQQEEAPLVLLNPISNELSVMRSSLWPGLLNAALYNQKRQQTRIRLFETGLCFQTQQGKLSQDPYLAAIATGTRTREQWGLPEIPLDFFTVKSDVEALFRLSGQLAQVQFTPGKHPALHPGQASQIMQGDTIIGYLGALHPKLLEKFDLLGPVYLFELALSAITQAHLPCFQLFSKFPVVRRDISFWIEEKFPVQRILAQIRIAAGAWLNDCYVFDVYNDKKLTKEKRSLALTLLWQHPDRTLVDTEVDDLVKKVIEGLKLHFSIQLRE